MHWVRCWPRKKHKSTKWKIKQWKRNERTEKKNIRNLFAVSIPFGVRLCENAFNSDFKTISNRNVCAVELSFNALNWIYVYGFGASQSRLIAAIQKYFYLFPEHSSGKMIWFDIFSQLSSKYWICWVFSTKRSYFSSNKFLITYMQTHFKLIELQLFPLKFNLSEEQYCLIIAVRALAREKERERANNVKRMWSSSNSCLAIWSENYDLNNPQNALIRTNKRKNWWSNKLKILISRCIRSIHSSTFDWETIASIINAIK